MTKLVINIGSAELAGDGESLRAAFAKINSNFTELYGNLQSVIPTASGQNGKYLKTDGTNLFWSEVTFNVTVDHIPPVNPVTGNLWYDTESGRMYVYYDTSWVDANPKGQTGTVLPNQNGNAGKFLTTDGSNLSWSLFGSLFDNLDVNGELNIITNNGTIRVRGNTPLNLNPNDSPHLHVESTSPTTTDLFFGDDLQFLRLAFDGGVILNARAGTMSPAVVKGADGVIVNDGSSISNIDTSDINVVVNVVNHNLSEGDKLYIQDIADGSSVELNNRSFYATAIVGNTFQLLDENHDFVLSADITPYVSGSGVIYSALRGGDVVINAGGLDDAYGDQGVVEVYGKTVSITTQTNNTWLFDGVNLTLPDGGDIFDSTGTSVLATSSVHLVSNPPQSSKGQSGDMLGMIVMVPGYLYYCFADYTDGQDDIWRRIINSGETW